jgi:endonuclease/exonuclease/phosphatase family metal-dependent hydrolase
MRTPAFIFVVLVALCIAACGPDVPSGDAPPSDHAEVVAEQAADEETPEAEAADDLEGELADDAAVEEVFVGTTSDELDPSEDDALDDALEEATPDEDVDEAPANSASPEPVVAAATAVTKTLRVLHWNIAGGKENACQTAGIKRAVLRYVREHDIDFVGLNEVCPSQYRAIRDALREHWGKPQGVTFSAFVGDGDVGRLVGNAIYSRRRFDTITRMKVGEDQFGDRNLLCGRVERKKHLRFCSAHLTPGDAAARRQLTKVHERIERWWSDKRDTVILSGDLNLNANDPGLNEVYAQAANTPNNPNNHGKYRELDDDDNNHCRGYGERSHAGNGGPCNTGGKIDFIFARANRIAGSYSGDTLDIPGDCTGACSDHRAMTGRADLRIRVE